MRAEYPRSDHVAIAESILVRCDIGEAQAICELAAGRLDVLTQAPTFPTLSTASTSSSPEVRRVGPDGQAWLTVSEAARELRCRPKAIRDAIKAGELPARYSPTGRRRGLLIATADLNRWATEHLAYKPQVHAAPARKPYGHRQAAQSSARSSSPISYTAGRRS